MAIREDRKIRIELAAPFEGWWADMRLHPPFALQVELESGDVDRAATALRTLVLDHNFRSEVGEADPVEDPLFAPSDAIAMLLQRYADLKAAVPNG